MAPPENCDRMVLISYYEQPEGRGLQTETRRFPINRRTKYKRLHRQVRKGFGLEQSFDLAYPMRCDQQTVEAGHDDREALQQSAVVTRWISMSGDHDIAHILNQDEAVELKVVPSANNISMNPFRRGWRKSLGFVEKHGPNILETISFLTSVYDAVHPAVLRITNGKHHRPRW